jgi:hypothetical protein
MILVDLIKRTALLSLGMGAAAAALAYVVSRLF